MKKCPECGAELMDEVQYCHQCGYILKDVEKTSTLTNNNKMVSNNAVVLDKKTSGMGWIVASLISFIISAIGLFMGFYKMLVYHNSDYSSLVKNAYVGGDAYNYIINACYTTAFWVFSTMFALMGVGFIIIHFLSKKEK